MRSNRRLKLILTFILTLSVLGYMRAFFEMDTSTTIPIKVFDSSFWGVGRSLSKVRAMLSPESRIEHIVTNFWDKTEVNTVYLKTRLSFRQQPDQSRSMNSSNSNAVVVIISSMPYDAHYRNVIRSTWADAKTAQRLGLRLVFTMGSSQEEISGLTEESNTYNDILIGNFTDGVRASTLKLLLGLTWVAHDYPDAKFVLLVDDKTFVNTGKLNEYLNSLEGDELVKAWHGRRSFATMPVRDPKSVYYVSKELYPRKAFPEYCTSEAGFILTMDAVKLILEHSHHAPLVAIGDVFVSIIAEKLSFRLINSDYFTVTNVSNGGCLLDDALTTRMTSRNATDFLLVYKNHIKGLNCSSSDAERELPGNGTNDKYFQQCLKTVITHDDVCFERTGEKKDVFLIALISTLPSHFARRQAIRETWGKQRVFFGKQTALLFTLATETKNTAEIQRKVMEENAQHGDIIQAEFRESFLNLTLKVVYGLKWLTENCPHTEYIYKGDDDIFVNMKNIITLLMETRQLNKTSLFMGNAMLRSRHVVYKRSKYYVPRNKYNGKFYPPYCSGGGYVISGNVIPALFEAARWVDLIPIDDAYQGILAKRVGLPVTHNERFRVFGRRGKLGQMSNKCFLEQCMVAHKHYRSPGELRAAWSLYTNDSIPCI